MALMNVRWSLPQYIDGVTMRIDPDGKASEVLYK